MSAASCWQRVGAQVYPQGDPQGYPQPCPQAQSSEAGHLCGTNVKPPACCHPPSPCEWRPTGGFDAPTLGGSSRPRQRCVGGRNDRLWTGLWAGWGRAGVFLWTGRDRDVHADRCVEPDPLATCVDGDPCCGRQRNRRILGEWNDSRTRLERCPRTGVHSVVQVSHAGGTVPAWLLPRVQWIQGVHCQRAQ